MPENETTIGGCSACGVDGVRVKAVEVIGREEPANLCALCRRTYTGNLAKYPDVSHGGGPDILRNQVRLTRFVLRRLQRIESTMTSRSAGGANAELRQRVTALEADVAIRQRTVDKYDEAATRARSALADAGVPDTEGAPPGRFLDLEARIKWLIRERDGWLRVIEECARIFECPDDSTTPNASNIPNLCRDLKHGIAPTAPTCSCDDPCDDPCPVHFRENDLQDIVLAAKESIAASLGVLRQGATDSTLASVITILDELLGVIDAGPRARIVAGGSHDSIRWSGEISLHAGTAAVILAAPSIRKAFALRDAARMQNVELAIRKHLGGAMGAGEVHGFDVTVDATNNPPSVMDAGRVVADIVVRLSPSASSAYASRYDFSRDDRRLVVRTSGLTPGQFVSEGTDEIRPVEE